MKIIKYEHIKNNKYKVYFSDDEVILYDDVIVKYNLLSKKEIDDTLYKEIISYNSELDSYYLSIKYIDKRLRSTKEIYEYLSKKKIDEKIINKTIERLKNTGYLNDEIFLKAYINDQINLSNHGKRKIIKDLEKLGISIDKINEYLDNIDHEIWLERIKKYCDKKISSNHNDSKYKLVNKLKRDLVNLGYDLDDVTSYLDRVSINDEEILKKTIDKVKKSLEKKYSGKELENKIKSKLYSKGFYVNDIEVENYEE